MARPIGRPKGNVFESSRRRSGLAVPSGAFSVEARSRIEWTLHKLWGQNSRHRVRFTSFRYREEGHPDWELCRGAEVAMLVMGRSRPEWAYGEALPLDKEAMRFLHWCRREVALNAGTRGGRKPNPDAIFKTALSAVVAAEVIGSLGRNHLDLPSAREISQIWYVLFREWESHEAIRARLKRTGQFCERYGEDPAFMFLRREKWVAGKHQRKFALLGTAILREV